MISCTLPVYRLPHTPLQWFHSHSSQIANSRGRKNTVRREEICGELTGLLWGIYFTEKRLFHRAAKIKQRETCQTWHTCFDVGVCGFGEGLVFIHVHQWIYYIQVLSMNMCTRVHLILPLDCWGLQIQCALNFYTDNLIQILKCTCVQLTGRDVQHHV